MPLRYSTPESHAEHQPLASSAAVRVLAEKGTDAGARGRLEVVEMHPQVGGIFDAAIDGERLVVRLPLSGEEIVGDDRGP